MNELIVVASLISLAVLIAVVWPFFWGDGGLLVDASEQDSPAKLLERKRFILKRWLEDEKAAGEGLITPREWQMRQVYLTNRYVDASRRLDWLEHEETKSP